MNIFMKGKKFILSHKNSMFIALIVFASLFLGIGYAQISNINVNAGGSATVDVTRDIFITDIEYVSGNLSDPTLCDIHDPYLTTMSSKIVLGNDLSSTITYKVTIMNNSDAIAVYDDALFSAELGYDNPDIEFVINGITNGEHIASREQKEFSITFKYKDSVASITDQELNSNIHFKFDTEGYYHVDEYVFDGTNYINTGIELFSTENINKNFEISFNIDSMDATQNELASLVNSMRETSPYPGFVYRLSNTNWQFNAPQIGTNNTNKNNVQKVVMKRVNDVYYLQLNDGNEIRLGTYSSGTTFNVPVTIGASLDSSGNPWRFFKGTLSDITVKVTTPEVYTIRYNPNGGTGTMGNQYVRRDETVSISVNTFEKEAKMLDYWNTEPDGTGVTYTEGQQVSNLGYNGEIVDLYAIWKNGINYSVHYNANGGVGSMNDQSFVYGSAQALSANGFTNPGYLFRGWNTAADGSGTFYNSGASVKNLTKTENEVVDLYAMWGAKTYSYSGEYVFTGNNFINTGVYLFSGEAISHDFDVSFEIINRVSTGNQATIVSCMDETGSPWPGIVYRIQSNVNDEIGANVTTNNKAEIRYNRADVNKVTIKKRSNILYINLNDDGDTQILDMTSLTNPFDVPLTFGCSLNGSGNPQRYFSGTIKDMNVIIYD